MENYNFQRERTRGCAPRGAPNGTVSIAATGVRTRVRGEAKNKNETREKPYINESVSGLDSALERSVSDL